MRILFIGSADVSSIVLDHLIAAKLGEIVGVIAQPPRPAGRHKHLTPCACHAHALSAQLPCYTPEKINAPESKDYIRALRPDVAIVVAYGQFLSTEILAIPPKGCLNVHLSLLPAYRGAAPIHAAILNGESETGTTIMLMDQGMDTGDILLQRVMPIRAEETVGTLHISLAHDGGRLLVETLPLWMSDQLQRHPQNHAIATYAKKIKKSEGFINWRLPAEEIERHIRAYNPWPACTTGYTYRNKPHRLKILAAQVLDTPADSGCGVIICNAPEGPIVKTGAGCLLLTEVQPDGCRPMSGRDFINGHALAPGDTFQ